jgi:hypothetical protein
MKPHNAGPGKGGGRRSPIRIPQVPMEWMDPLSWRLPSGKALAEFALQAGFLAPLLLGTPSFNKKKTKAPRPMEKVDPPGPKGEFLRADVRAEMKPGMAKIPVREEPENSGSFRGTR